MPRQVNGQSVFASHATSVATSPVADGTWQDIEFAFGEAGPSAEIPCGQAISALIRAYATAASVTVRGLARVDEDYGWVQIIPDTVVAIDAPAAGILLADTALFEDTIRYAFLRLQVQESGGGGTATVAVALK